MIQRYNNSHTLVPSRLTSALSSISFCSLTFSANLDVSINKRDGDIGPDEKLLSVSCSYNCNYFIFTYLSY